MSSGPLFLDRVAPQQSASPLRRQNHPTTIAGTKPTGIARPPDRQARRRHGTMAKQIGLRCGADATVLYRSRIHRYKGERKAGSAQDTTWSPVPKIRSQQPACMTARADVRSTPPSSEAATSGRKKRLVTGDQQTPRRRSCSLAHAGLTPALVPPSPRTKPTPSIAPSAHK